MKIKYFAWLKNINNIDEEIIRKSSIKDINSLKKYLSKKYPKFKIHFDKDIIRFAVNLSHINKNKKIKSSDEIALFPPVSGG